MKPLKTKQPRINRARRLAICQEFGVTYSPRQWVTLRKELRRRGLSLTVEEKTDAKA